VAKRQLSFLGSGLKQVASQFGGALLKGNPKEKRPLTLKTPLHLVLKSQKAFGPSSMLAKAHAKKIDQLVRKQASACGVKIYHFVNVGNHLHLVVRLQDRRLYRVFIRAVSGLIARQVLGTERGPQAEAPELSADLEVVSETKTKKTQFWVARPFTRLVTWGPDYKGLSRYMKKNQAQADLSGARFSEKSSPAVVGFDLQFSFMNTA
jgi:REP element-mobilizing transposase RayT